MWKFMVQVESAFLRLKQQRPLKKINLKTSFNQLLCLISTYFLSKYLYMLSNKKIARIEIKRIWVSLKIFIFDSYTYTLTHQELLEMCPFFIPALFNTIFLSFYLYDFKNQIPYLRHNRAQKVFKRQLCFEPQNYHIKTSSKITFSLKS